MKTSARILAGWTTVAASLFAGSSIAAPPREASDTATGFAVVADDDSPASSPKDKRRQASDLLRRARRAMAQDNLAAAESLISAAEALHVRYGLLHLGDTPKRARQDLQRMRAAAKRSAGGPSQLFSQLSSKKKAPPTNPFAGRVRTPPAGRLDETGRPASDFPGFGGNGNGLPGEAGLPSLQEVASLPLSRPPDPVRLPSPPGRSGSRFPSVGSAAAMPPDRDRIRLSVRPASPVATESAGRDTVGSAKADGLLLQARRALAVGDVRRATTLVSQAKLRHAEYGPLEDNPEKVEAAIRKYREVAAQPGNTEGLRRRRVRMLMEQAEALLLYHDYDQAERLADRASREQLTYDPFEAKPSDLLARIAAARRQGDRPAGSPSTPLSMPLSTPPSRGGATAASGDLPAPSLAARQKAVGLVRQARQALAAGDFSRAEVLARQAEQLGVPDSAYTAGEDRPGLVLLAAREARLRGRSGVIRASGELARPATGASPIGQAALRASYDPSRDTTRNVPAALEEPRFPTTVRPLDFAQAVPGPMPAREPEPSPPTPAPPDPNAQSAFSLFSQGEAALESGDTEQAYRYFQQAAAYMDQLDPITHQRLQERLQLLSAPRRSGDGGVPSESLVDDTAARQHALARQVSADIAHQAAQARGMLPSDPQGAVALLEETRKTVETAGLGPAIRQQLLRRVDRHLAEAQQFIEQNRPRIELEETNRQTREQIEREQRLALERQDKLALMVDDFKRKMDEQRYTEAEVVAKRAAELAPDEPVVQLLLHESKMIRRYANNLALQAAKEQGLLDALSAVDKSSVPFNDLDPYVFPDAKRWEDISGTRSKFVGERGRQRSEKELEIERKLKTPVSFQFQDKPLSEALDQLTTQADINLHLDPQGLAEEGITSSTPVSLSVRNEIMLKSALNLILEPLHLSYVIKDEVLKITSEQLRDGEVYSVSYPVADLVVPIPNFVPGDMGLAAAYQKAMGNVGFGGAHIGMGAPPMAVLASKEGSQGAAAINPALLAQVSGPGQPASGVGNLPMGFGPGGLGGASQADFDSLIDLITATVEPTSWDLVGGPGSIAPFETNLSIVVSQTQDVHEQIVDLLEQLRRMQDLQVTIEVRFITLNDNFFERLGIDFDFDINDNIDRQFQVFGRPDPTTSTTYTTTLEANGGPARDVLDRDHDRSVTVGLNLNEGTTPAVFSADLDIPFRQNSFGLAIPQFGGFDATAGAQLGFAILSDIEAFFFINAAQGDRRSNVLQAPKVTLFNGQNAFVSDTSQSPFVVSVVPVVGDFAAAQQPVIVVLSEGTFMTVQAVVSNDRRFVRLTIVPFFSRIGEVNTFQFTGSETTTTNTTAEGIQDERNDHSRNSDSSTVTRSGTTVQLPTFSFVQVTTTVSVPDGGTVLLGGIKRLSEGRNEFGVPVLAKLPYINRLFKNVGIGRETQSLMMMVTPRIIIQEEEELAQTGYSPPP